MMKNVEIPRRFTAPHYPFGILPGRLITAMNNRPATTLAKFRIRKTQINVDRFSVCLSLIKNNNLYITKKEKELLNHCD